MGFVTVCLVELNPLHLNSTEATSTVSVRSLPGSNKIELVLQWVNIIIVITWHFEYLLCASIVSKLGMLSHLTYTPLPCEVGTIAICTLQLRNQRPRKVR